MLEYTTPVFPLLCILPEDIFKDLQSRHACKQDVEPAQALLVPLEKQEAHAFMILGCTPLRISQ